MNFGSTHRLVALIIIRASKFVRGHSARKGKAKHHEDSTDLNPVPDCTLNPKIKPRTLVGGAGFVIPNAQALTCVTWPGFLRSEPSLDLYSGGFGAQHVYTCV